MISGRAFIKSSPDNVYVVSDDFINALTDIKVAFRLLPNENKIVVFHNLIIGHSEWRVAEMMGCSQTKVRKYVIESLEIMKKSLCAKNGSTPS